jgi:hypothetical protein
MPINLHKLVASQLNFFQVNMEEYINHYNYYIAKFYTIHMQHFSANALDSRVVQLLQKDHTFFCE